MERRIAEVPVVRVGRPQHRPHAPGCDPVLPDARLPGAAPGALHRRRRQSPQPARQARRGQPGDLQGGRGPARRADRKAGRPATGAHRARPDRAAFRARGRCGSDREGRGACCRITDAKGERLSLRSRPASANLAETTAFMDGEKRILVFSMAGGTGRSYHADLSCGNTERRIHYLLEPGWRADQAIQGLGRTHRTHQASAPLFRPCHHRREGRAPVHRHHRTAARQPRSHHARGSAIQPDRHGRQRRSTVSRERQSGEPSTPRLRCRQFYGALWYGSIEGWNR